MSDHLTQLPALVQLNPALTYLVAVSLVTFLLFGYDKFKARSGWWRTPEKFLLGFCLAGGTIGGGLGMILFRHKISKRPFVLSYFAILAIQACLVGFLVFR